MVRFIERRDSEEAQALQALEEKREATETMDEKIARLKEENRLLKLKLSELAELGRD